MKLLYVPIPNFGDALNPWIWTQLLPEIQVDPGGLDPVGDTEELYLCSIGSFLSEQLLRRLKPGQKLIVAGTGAGYGQHVHAFSLGAAFPMTTQLSGKTDRICVDPDRVMISWVRGPLTADLCGLPSNAAVADAAYLLRQVLPQGSLTRAKSTQPAFMPHTGTVCLVDWHAACEELGWTFIDPNSSREVVLEAIGSASVLITEALHGAIVADALRTPWIPTRSSGDILAFKWRDHCASIGVEYQPTDIRVHWSVKGVANTQRHPLKRVAFGGRTVLHNLTASKAGMLQQLEEAAKRSPSLSDDATIARIDERLAERLEMLRDHLHSRAAA